MASTVRAAGRERACELATRELVQCKSCRHQASVTAGHGVASHAGFPCACGSRRPIWSRPTHRGSRRSSCSGNSASTATRRRGRCCRSCAVRCCARIGDRLAGVVEVDETYVGGVEAGRRGGRQRDSTKSIVVGAVEVRGGGSGRIRLAVVDDLTATSLGAFVTASVAPGSVVLTDRWQGYAPLRHALRSPSVDDR